MDFVFDSLRIRIFLRRLIICAFVALVPHGAWAAADNFGLAGDARVRGFWVDNNSLIRSTAEIPAKRTGDNEDNNEDVSGTTRLRLSLYADPSDALSLQVTGQGTGKWGREFHDDRASANVSEAVVLIENIGFSPLSIKFGRQTAGYGSGLIISDADDAWIMDAVRLEYDAFPVTMHLLYAEISHLAPDTDVEHFGWMNIGHSFERHILHDVEFYSGVFTLREEGCPILTGVRSVLYRSRDWFASTETAYQFGDGTADEHLSAFIIDMEVRRSFSRIVWRPTLEAGWTYGSGDRASNGRRTFVDLLHYENRGMVLSPRLGNIHIFALRGRISPAPGFSITIDAFHYRQDEPVAGPVTAGTFNNGGYAAPADGEHRELGTELDVVLDYTPHDDVSLQVRAGYLWAGAAYSDQPGAKDAAEVRAQLTMQFP